MKPAIRTNIARLTTALLTTLLMVGCSSTSSPYNDPDSQRERADKTQREMSR